MCSSGKFATLRRFFGGVVAVWAARASLADPFEPEIVVESPRGKIDKLVLVVHGVGDPQPGETISRFARSVALEESPLEEHQRTIWLPEKADDRTTVKTFASHIRRLCFDDKNIEMAEVFWGDLSRVRKGILGVFRGLFQILFGLRYVAYVAADQPGQASLWLKRLGLISSRILHGPVLAITFFLTLLALAILGTQLMWTESYKGHLWTQVVLAGCCTLALLAAGVGWNLTRSRVIERFWFWVNVTGLFVGGLMLVKAMFLDMWFPSAVTDSIRPGLIWYCRVLVVLLGTLWFAEILVLVSMVFCWFVCALRPDTYRPAVHIAFLLPALAVGVWGQMLPMFWISAKRGIDSFARLPEFAAVFDEAIPLLGVQFLMVVVSSCAAALIVFNYFNWRKKYGVDDYLNGNQVPRLIVHGGLQLVMAICTLIGISLVFTIGTIEAIGYSHREFLFGKVLVEINNYAVGLLVPLGGLVMFLLPHFRPAFDILLDVVNHFYFRATDIVDALNDDDEFDISETTFESGSLFFCHRDRIHGRLKRILNFYRDQLGENRPNLVLVAHSQGTMIAIEVLNDPDLAWIRNQFRKVTLVTMGSPMKNLYQHYFRHLYPPLNQPFWSQLRQRVDRWINIYRVDDYVGREIDFPGPHDVAVYERGNVGTPTEYCNHAVGPRGHQGYWFDREVLQILRDHILGQHQQGCRHAA